jgi:uncharacterized protein
MKRCTVVYALPERQWLWKVEAPEEATVHELLELARSQAQVAAPWDGEVGIFGQRVDRAAVPRDGDRLELYRPLRSDPKESRRARAAARRGAPGPAPSRPRTSSPKPVR